MSQGFFAVVSSGVVWWGACFCLQGSIVNLCSVGLDHRWQQLLPLLVAVCVLRWP